MRYEIAARSIIGGRSYQEDSWRVRDQHGIDLGDQVGQADGVLVPRAALIVVADGMGGHGGGAPASRLVADSFTAAFFTCPPGLSYHERLDHSLTTANRTLAEAKRAGSELNDKSGTTLVAGALLRNWLVFLSVGDSSIWRFRDKEVHRINATHERAADVDVRAAELNTDEAWDYALGDESRFAITSAVMGYDVREKQIDARRIEPNDVLVFASDGIETLSLEHLRRAVPAFLERGGVGAVAQGLSDLVQRTGGDHQDNTTLVVVRALPNNSGRVTEDAVQPGGLEETTAPVSRTAPVGRTAVAGAAGADGLAPPGDGVVAAAPQPPAQATAQATVQAATTPVATTGGGFSLKPWLAGMAVAVAVFLVALAVGLWFGKLWPNATPAATSAGQQLNSSARSPDPSPSLHDRGSLEQRGETRSPPPRSLDPPNEASHLTPAPSPADPPKEGGLNATPPKQPNGR